MLKSNQAALPSSTYRGRSSLGNIVNDNLSTLDNIRIKKQIRNAQKGRNNGDSSMASSIQKTVAQNVGRSAIRPLIRKRTGREFAND